MKKILTIVIVINFFLIAGIVLHAHRVKNPDGEENINNKIVTKEQTSPKTPPEPKPEPEIKKYEPQWTNYPPTSNQTQGRCKIWLDVMNHANEGEKHKKDGPCTQVHETLHGICKRDSSRYGIYCFNSRLAWVSNLDTTLNTVSSSVPQSLRGKTYNLYLKKQQIYFNTEPIYIFDEWCAYAGGSACAIDMTENEGWREQRWDTILFMREFDVYALTLAFVTKPTDEQFKNFLGWQLERTAKLYDEARKHPNLTHQWQEEYLNKLRTSPDAEELRKFTREYLGAEWAKRVLGF